LKLLDVINYVDQLYNSLHQTISKTIQIFYDQYVFYDSTNNISKSGSVSELKIIRALFGFILNLIMNPVLSIKSARLVYLDYCLFLPLFVNYMPETVRFKLVM